MMDLDELRSVQSRERQTDSLQQLRESFYRDAGEFIQQLHRERERAAEEADDPWNAPEVTRLSDDIDTAEQTVEAIYERRVGKIVKMASLAAADMPTEDEGLTAEEQRLFDTLVEAIERNRANVEAVIDGEDPPASVADAGADSGAPPDANASSTASDDASEAPTGEGSGSLDAPVGAGSDSADDAPPDSPAAADEARPAPPDRPTEAATDASEVETGVDAADLMGGDGSEAADTGSDAAGGAATDGSSTPPGGEGDRQSPPSDGAGEAPPATVGSDSSAAGSDDPTAGDNLPEENADGESAGEATDGDAPGVDRATVRITADVGEIFGVDERAYDLSTDDVVQLPEANAGPLVERDAAERLD